MKNLVFAFNGLLFSDYLINFINLSKCLKILIGTIILIITSIEILNYFLFFSDGIAYISHWIGWIIGFILGFFNVTSTGLMLIDDNPNDSFR